MNKEIIAFNSGEMTPEADAREDIEKYSSGCRHLENMFPLIYGDVEKRPGTKVIHKVFVPETLLVYPTLHELTRELPSMVSYDNINLSYENSTIESDIEEENRIYYNGKLVSYENKQVFYFGVGSTNWQANFVPTPILIYCENDIICWENETIITTGEIIYCRNIICWENDEVFWEDDVVVALVEIPTAPAEPYVQEIHQVYYDVSTPNLANRQVVTYEDDPVFYYENWSPVTTAADLQAMEKSRRYYLTGDIDLTGVTWTPIGNFSGALNGNGYTISNLTINSPTLDNLGLFGTFTRNGRVYDLKISNFSVTGDDYIGALIGRFNVSTTTDNSIILKNIIISNSTVVSDTSSGGICGYIQGLSRSCFYNCSVVNCDIISTLNSGGLCGGIINTGNSLANTFIIKCSVTGGTINGANYTGGFCGILQGKTNAKNLTIHSCYSASVVNAMGLSDSVGGFCGWANNDLKLINCYATEDVVAPETNTGIIGGLVGYEGGKDVYINCYSTGNVTTGGSGENLSTWLVGGFIGKCDYGDPLFILRCYSIGNIKIYNTDDWYGIGGFVGGFLGGGGTISPVVQRCWSIGDIYIETEVYPGGLDWNNGVGGVTGEILHVIKNKYGLVVENCYSWGSISTDTLDDDSVRGGFIGIIVPLSAASDITLANCYSAQTNSELGSNLIGQIPVGTYSGGFLGYTSDPDGTTVNNSFYDTETSSLSVSELGDGQDTQAMMTKSNYQSAGWDFSDIWEMVEL